MAIDDKRMTIWGHLSELRKRLTVIAISIIVVVCVAYFFSGDIAAFLLMPVADHIPNPNGLPLDEVVRTTYVMNALEPFTIRFFISFVTSIVVCSPIWIWQILAFFLPALNPNERKWVIPTFFAAVFLFLLGVVFCYLIILDPAFDWILDQAAGFFNLLPSSSNYIDTILLFEVAFGIAFELPLIVFYLTIFNIVPYKKLRQSWRVVYVGLLVLCAMVTPDASPITMLLMFAAMAVLYEASLFLSRIVLRRRIKENEERERKEAEQDRLREERRRAAADGKGIVKASGTGAAPKAAGAAKAAAAKDTDAKAAGAKAGQGSVKALGDGSGKDSAKETGAGEADA